MPAVLESPVVSPPSALRRVGAAPGVRLGLQPLPGGGFVLDCRPNRALPPTQLIWALGLACVGPAVVGLGFLSAGVAMVIPFAVIELLALGAALLVFSRHALDGETLTVSRDQVHLAQRQGSRLRQGELPLQGLRVSFRDGADGGRVELRHGQRTMLLGAWLRPSARAGLALDIDRMLGAVRAGLAPTLEDPGLK